MPMIGLHVQLKTSQWENLNKENKCFRTSQLFRSNPKQKNRPLEIVISGIESILDQYPDTQTFGVTLLEQQ